MQWLAHVGTTLLLTTAPTLFLTLLVLSSPTLVFLSFLVWALLPPVWLRGAQAFKGRVTRQGLLSLEAPPEVVQAANRVADSIETTASAVREADLARSTLNISMAASDIRMAATQVSSSLNGFTDMLSSFSKTFTQGASKMLSDGISTFLTWVAKVFGYLLVLFGSPTPMSIAGLLVIICADLAPQASEYFHSCSSVLGSLYYWIATKLGLSVTPEEAHAATVEHQGVRDYNDAVNAVKNTECSWTRAGVGLSVC